MLITTGQEQEGVGRTGKALYAPRHSKEHRRSPICSQFFNLGEINTSFYGPITPLEEGL